MADSRVSALGKISATIEKALERGQDNQRVRDVIIDALNMNIAERATPNTFGRLLDKALEEAKKVEELQYKNLYLEEVNTFHRDFSLWAGQQWKDAKGRFTSKLPRMAFGALAYAYEQRTPVLLLAKLKNDFHNFLRDIENAEEETLPNDLKEFLSSKLKEILLEIDRHSSLETESIYRSLKAIAFEFAEYNSENKGSATNNIEFLSVAWKILEALSVLTTLAGAPLVLAGYVEADYKRIAEKLPGIEQLMCSTNPNIQNQGIDLYEILKNKSYLPNQLPAGADDQTVEVKATPSENPPKPEDK
jgi:predicted nucleic acid-binding protein